MTPSDASRLDLWQNRGTLRLSLRNPEDTVTDDIEMATLLEMRGPSATPYVVATSADTSASDSRPSEGAEPLVTEIAPTIVRTPEILLPIRTLRGTSSGAAYVRQQLGRTIPEEVASLQDGK